jgi:hypothetical protein
VKRTINGFEVDRIGTVIIELVRTTAPMHRYVFEISPDGKLLKRLHSILPMDVPAGDPLSHAEQFEQEARKAAERYLHLESESADSWQASP